MNRAVWLTAIMVFGSAAQAANLAFDQLTDGQTKSIIKEFSANFTQTSVSGASPLGDVFGFEIGVIAGMTKTDDINTLAKSADPSLNVDKIPHASLVALVTVPFGVTLEANLVPEVGNDDFKFSNMGLGAKWSLTSSVLELPLSLAIKAHYMKTKLKFKQTVSSVDANVDFDDMVTGAMLLVSKKFAFVEPYIGYGMVSGNGDFDVQGTTQFFQSGVTNYSSKESGSHLVVGAELGLLFLKIGAEYAQLFGTSRYSAKVALSF